jgi:hypothetical protein
VRLAGGRDPMADLSQIGSNAIGNRRHDCRRTTWPAIVT